MTCTPAGCSRHCCDVFLSLWNNRDSYEKMARILYEEEPFVYPKFMRRIISAMDNDK